MKKTLSILSLLTFGLGSQLSAQGIWTGSTISTITSGKVGIGTGTSTPEGKLSINETQSLVGFAGNDYTGKSLVIKNTNGIGNAEFNIMEVHNRPATMPEANYSLIYWLSNKGNVGIKSLATGGSNKMVVSNTAGQLINMPLPTLNLSGSTLSISGGNSVTLPSGSGDNLGNHTASANLNMNSKDINNLYGIQFQYGGRISSSGSGGIDIQLVPSSNGDIYVSGGDINVNGGSVYATSFHSTSDIRLKNNVTSIDKKSNRIMELNPIKYNFKKGIDEKINDEKIHFGFSAQEVQKIFPNLVNEKKGYLRVNYIEFIPLLLQQIQDQNERIEALEETIRNKSSVKLTDELGTSIQNSTLGQNVPNPFDKETTISYNIKQNFNTAFIGVYDLNGKQIKRIPINKSKSEIIIPANIFVAGTYIYSLVVDGKLVESKKMIVI
ncbi:tail fiber domain-containing protein [Chryseobacterium sp.]|uniref:tail fiber domain-containing protein n=1 Tax=Chryseobacterium sp. TaxID=1871047 RepID=UPI000EE656D8|nr:tail fiber domain-containing protein [Chryseobacterium sp.]HCA05970.1 hypothetical protein [Chryseobacterium sp.]